MVKLPMVMQKRKWYLYGAQSLKRKRRSFSLKLPRGAPRKFKLPQFRIPRNIKLLKIFLGTILPDKLVLPSFSLRRGITFRHLRLRKGKRSIFFWANLFAGIFFAFLVLATLGGGLAFFVLARDLPSPNKLVAREVPLSTKIYDRGGELLYDIYSDQNRTLVTLAEIPEHLRLATISMEDKNFYKHQGFDPLGIVRAVRNMALKKRLEGGSTITQQLVKNALLSRERTVVRKIKEFVLALAIEQRFSKDEILQMYLNEVPYGGQAWGVQAASQTYFGKNVKDLTLAEAALLAGLPAAPSKYSPHRDPELAVWRQGEVLRRMTEDGYLTQEQADAARAEPLSIKPPGTSIHAPHFVMYVKELLTERYGVDLVERGGLRVTTTLDLGKQEIMQQIVVEELDKVKKLLVGNAALVAVDPRTGEILALVGSKNYFDTENDGNFNAALGLRQPGSSIKPLNYVTAFKQGFPTSLTLMDVPTLFPGGAGQPPYDPVNYDGIFVGPIQLRQALGNSRNIPAVKLLALAGVGNMIDTATGMGITTFTDPSQYGLALTLGGGGVKLLDMTVAFSGFATLGIRHDPVAILKVTDSYGNVLEEFKPTPGQRVLTEPQAYLMVDILSDAQARLPAFGGHAAFNILGVKGHSVFVKTGTSNDKRDNWTLGGSKSVMIGVWTGNNDNSPMHPTLSSGITGAAPIWRRAIGEFLKDKPNEPFERPGGIVSVTVDALSGKLPGPHTQATRGEIFIAGSEPKEVDDWHLKLKICKPDGKLASEACRKAGQSEERIFIKLKEQKEEWQSFTDDWVSKTYPKEAHPEYYPPTEVSTLCFDIDGNVIGDLDCKPLVEIGEPEDGFEYTSGKEFTVKAKATTPEGVTALQAEFYVCTPPESLYADDSDSDADEVKVPSCTKQGEPVTSVSAGGTWDKKIKIDVATDKVVAVIILDSTGAEGFATITVKPKVLGGGTGGEGETLP